MRVLLALLCIALAPGAAPPCQAQTDIVLEESPLFDITTDYAKAHPNASGEEIAAFANARLAEHGIDYDVTYLFDNPPDKQLLLQAGQHRFAAKIPEVPESSPCGEYYLTVPALRADDQTIDIVHKGEVYRVNRSEDLRLDRIVIYAPDQKTVLSQFEAPWQGEIPAAVLPDGSAVFFIVGLGKYKHLGPAWKGRDLSQEFAGPYPTLLLQVSANGLKFVGDARLYDAGEPIEEIKDWPGAPEFYARERRRFGHSSLVVEFPGPGPACT